jgi:aminomethyltransferase
VRRGAKIVPFAGYLMPLQYGKIIDEHLMVRKNAGLFDVSHMARMHARGKGAQAFCRKISVNNVNNLKDGRGQYSVLCNEQGCAIDDFTIFRFNQEHFELIVNASRRQVVWKWLMSICPKDVALTDHTDSTALIAIQGPKATALVSKLANQPLDHLKLFAFVHANLLGIPVLLCRSGYTGEDGFEIECAADRALEIWESLLEEGGQTLIAPIGLGARDTLRLEMGYMLYGHELDEQTTPLEAGLDWVVKLNDDDFIGKTVLLKQQQDGLKKRLIGVKGTKSVIPRAEYELAVDGQVVGKLTSGGFSPSLQVGIGMGYVAAVAANLKKIDLLVRGQQIPVDVIKPPFITMKR